jgi:hypothetical protein
MECVVKGGSRADKLQRFTFRIHHVRGMTATFH